MSRFFTVLLFSLFSAACFSQSSPYAANLIDPFLTKDAYAVVRDEKVETTVEAIDKLRIVTRRAITVLNKKGDRYAFAGDVYSNNIKVKNQHLLVYDKNGMEIKRVKAKEFQDRSAVSSGTLYSDTRISYFDFTPHDYPYTLVYESEVEKENTIFVNDWSPVKGFHVSVEKSVYTVKNPTGILLRFKEQNLDSLEVEKNNPDNGLQYKLKNFPAFKFEFLSPALEKFEPGLKVALEEFSLVGVQGEATSWSDFGKWQYEHLLHGRNVLSQATVSKITQLTAKAETDVEKAKIIYDYVQQNSRYISVQLGIGGWEPISAAEVDNLKYGDCKGLTNYTKALLDSQGIPSNYAVVYAGEEKRDIDGEFASMQGNHVILNLPQPEGENIWLECTSQTLPFNYLGDFTDDRNVLLVKPEGGEIVRTKRYSAEENLTESFTTIALDDKGNFQADVLRKTTGIPYGDVYRIEALSEKDQKLRYKEEWGHLKNLLLETPVFNNDREKQEFTEKLQFKGDKFAVKAGTRLLLPLNFYNSDNYAIPFPEERKLPLEIQRGSIDVSTFQFTLPEGYSVEAIPEGVMFESKFGSMEVQPEIKEVEGRKIVEVRRIFRLNEGTWPAESHLEFRIFMGRINALGNLKAVLNKNT